jgi:hypothetical protein
VAEVRFDTEHGSRTPAPAGAIEVSDPWRDRDREHATRTRRAFMER